ncbi:MAG: AbrB/MazE/SpoVT family DNA-binding domain-containing protein [Bacillota bacterium]|uniref:AbrB/MazE/SpoVT family DNA-binding domain-containing protein n=1 Tax=Desulfurispora thermophila TaxID=265470 RepID=UPI00035F63A1|nr:AbrB/MazE/SpoVT family DNA-binding domain-containing protein [Desulfurispora thermophila]
MVSFIARVEKEGRVFLPVQVREQINIRSRDLLKFCRVGEYIIVEKKYQTCIFCGQRHDLVEFRSKYLCRGCRSGLLGMVSVPVRKAHLQVAHP